MTAQNKLPEQSLFRYITDDEFRSSLENDFTELEQAKRVGAWKCVHVLAGSIVEAVLIDYLLAVKYKGFDDQKILKMDLKDCIEACQAEGILDEDAEKIGTVIKDFRNLIHPGRIKRLGKRVDDAGAAMAEGFLKRIVGDVMKNRKAVYGPTAEDIADKLLKHPGTTILDALLRGINGTERRLLLLKYLPDSLESSRKNPDTKIPASKVFRECYRINFEQVDSAVKREAVLKYEAALLAAAPDRIDMYEHNFFQAGDLQYLKEGERTLIVGHLMAVLKAGFLEACGRPLMQGIGSFLAPSDVRGLFPGLLMGNGKYNVHLPDVRAAWVAREYRLMSDQAAEEFRVGLDNSVSTPDVGYTEARRTISQETISALKKLIEGLR